MLKSRGKGTRREVLLGGDKIEWNRGRKYTMLSYSGLAKGEGYFVIEQLVTVHCSFLYFGLVSTVT